MLSCSSTALHKNPGSWLIRQTDVNVVCSALSCPGPELGAEVVEGMILPHHLLWQSPRWLAESLPCQEFCLTHAVLHHHEPTLIALEALAFKAAWSVDAGAMATQVW